MVRGKGFAIAASGFVLEEVESIPCPICGQGMRWEEVAWFCRSSRVFGGEEEGRPCTDVLDLSIPEAEFRAIKGRNPALDDLQFYAKPHCGVPVVHFMAQVEEITVEAHFVRGSWGRTNFTARLWTPPGWGGKNLFPSRKRLLAATTVAEYFRSGGRWLRRPWWRGWSPPTPIFPEQEVGWE